MVLGFIWISLVIPVKLPPLIRDTAINITILIPDRIRTPMVQEPIPADMEDQQGIIQNQELDHDHVAGNSLIRQAILPTVPLSPVHNA